MRVTVDEEQIAHPGPTHFEPASGTTSFSFAFAVNLGPFEQNDHHGFDVQWRSTTGANVTLNRGLINVIYQEGTRQCP